MKLRVALIALSILFCISVSGFAGEVNGVLANKAALKAVNALEGFTATYVGESQSSETKPELTIAYQAPHKLAIRVPMMQFAATHVDGNINVSSQGSGVLMPIKDVMAFTAEAEKDLLTLPWLDIENPNKSPMKPWLSFDLGEGTLNIGIEFGENTDTFSWIQLLHDSNAIVTDEKDAWKIKVPLKDGRANYYLVLKENGVLKSMYTAKGEEIERKISLTKLTTTRPDDSVFKQPAKVQSRHFKDLPENKSAFLMGVYRGVQEAILRDVMPRWKTMDMNQRKALAKGVSTYWRLVFKNMLAANRKGLEAQVSKPENMAKIKSLASNKEGYNQFIQSLPAAQKPQAKKLWAEQILGMAGKELLDPLVGWIWNDYIESTKIQIAKKADAFGLDNNEKGILLGVLTLPIVDACFMEAEPILLPKLVPAIEEASAGLE